MSRADAERPPAARVTRCALRRPHLAEFSAGLILLAAVVVNQSAVHWRSDLYDDDLFAYHGWCVAQGLRPYLDIWDNKPPGIWWLNALGVLVAGTGLNGVLLICSAGLTTALLGLTLIATATYGRALLVPAALLGALLLTDLRFDGGANRTEPFLIGCEIAAVLAYVRWRASQRTRWLALGGLAAGTAALFKQAGLAAAAVCLLHLLWTSRRAATAHTGPPAGLPDVRSRAFRPDRLATLRPALIWLGACTTAPLLAGLYLGWIGALDEAAFAIGRFNRAYFLVHDATWLRMDRALTVSWPILSPLTFWFGLACVAVALGAWTATDRARRRPRTAIEAQRAESTGGPATGAEASGTRASGAHASDTRASESHASGAQAGNAASAPQPAQIDFTDRAHELLPLYLGWLLLAAYLALAGPGRRGHHFLPLLPPLALLVLFPLHLLLRSGAGGAAVSWSRALTAHPIRVALLVLLAYGGLRFGLGNWREMERGWALKPAWWSLTRRSPTPGEEQAAEIRRQTAPQDTIYVAGWSPSTYRHAYRRPASRFATFEKLGQVGEHAQFIHDQAFADLRRNPPALFVISISDHERMRRADDPHARWLAEHYRLHRTISGIELHQRFR